MNDFGNSNPLYWHYGNKSPYNNIRIICQQKSHWFHYHNLSWRHINYSQYFWSFSLARKHYWAYYQLDTTDWLYYPETNLYCCCSVHSVMFNSASQWLQHTRLPCHWPSPRVFSDSCPLSPWCHPTIPSSVTPFSSCPQSFPASGSFPMSQPFASGGQIIGDSALASFLPMNTQNWSPLGWTGWISLLSKWLSRVFSNTTVQKHQFFGAQLSSQSNSHIHTWPQEKPYLN